jgi:uncharacterized protein YbjQ (UPF0145 family)
VEEKNIPREPSDYYDDRFERNPTIREQAQRVGANAIVGFRISPLTERGMQGSVSYGTAIFYTEKKE